MQLFQGVQSFEDGAGDRHYCWARISKQSEGHLVAVTLKANGTAGVLAIQNCGDLIKPMSLNLRMDTVEYEACAGTGLVPTSLLQSLMPSWHRSFCAGCMTRGSEVAELLLK